MMSRFLFCFTVMLLVNEPVFAADTSDSFPSPDRQFIVFFPDQETFTIQDASGGAVVSSRDLPRLQDVVEFRPEHVLWSPDSQILAIAGGGGHDLETFILFRRGNSFDPVTVPDLTDRLDNPFVTPAKWIKGRRLILDISGPNAGKASQYYYKGRATIRLSTKPPACEVLYNRINVHN